MRKKHTWIWQGISAQQQILSGEILAFSINLARHALLQKNIRVTSLHKKRYFIFKKSQKPKQGDLILFFRQLSTLMNAGIPLLQTLQMINRNPEQNRLQAICTKLIEHIRQGSSLEQSLRQFPKYFDRITCQLISAGEKSGTLDIMLERIANHREQLAHLKKKIIQTLFYPSITFFVAIGITLIMLIFITPRFAALFHDMHAQLPFFTRLVISLGSGLRYAFLPLTVIFFILSFFIMHHPKCKHWLDRILLKIPLLGNILSKIQHARFARTLAILFTAGLPLPEALQLIAPAIGNQRYTDVIQQLQHALITGQSLHYAIQQSGFFPATLQQLIEVGEESGTLEKMLLKSSEFLETEVDHFIFLASQLLEPLIILFLGVLIGTLLVAMYLPIFKLGSVI